MKSYDIWIEGYRATGEQGRAHWAGSAEGNTFKEACINFSKTSAAKGYGNFDPEHLTFWGCECFDNAIDAMEAFG